jgi:hypothetical protein
MDTRKRIPDKRGKEWRERDGGKEKQEEQENFMVVLGWTFRSLE